MKAALLLIDMQADYLAAPGLQPAAGEIVAACARLLESFRRRGLPVVHVWTTVDRTTDLRMPHWKQANRWRCEAGTPGHQTPVALQPISGETIVHKQFFSGFGTGELDATLRALECEGLVLAGVHTHGCVRATALDAYEGGYRVWIAADAVGSDDPVHAAITRRYLAGRCATVETQAAILAMIDGAKQDMPLAGVPVDVISHYSPADVSRKLWQVPASSAAEIAQAAAAARGAWEAWRAVDLKTRATVLRRWAEILTERTPSLAPQIMQNVGKPIRMARGEIARSAAILKVVADYANEPLGMRPSDSGVGNGGGGAFRYEPLGLVGLITPWNNPVAIPVGKIAPALLYGNGVLWKPAPAGTMIARAVLEAAHEAGVPDHLIELCIGDHQTARLVAENSEVDAVTLSGSLAAGYALHEVCLRRHVPFQGELGGNNAAIVADDAAPQQAAAMIAEGAFGFAGQRCTANRRVIISDRLFEPMLEALSTATAHLPWGDPSAESTIVGPVISQAKQRSLESLVNRARHAGLQILTPHRTGGNIVGNLDCGAFFPPTIVVADDPASEIVQEESFGPILVVQRAKDFNHALELCNGVRQGLVAALFSQSQHAQDQFLREARAGVLKLNQATADADAASPLGGWKASGIGPAEHGPSDREFYCRVQTIYGGR